MKLLLATTTEAELEGLQDLLRKEGVLTELRRTGISDEPGEEPFRAELWVTRDRDLPRAKMLFRAWSSPLATTR
jgi:hypothetical protein